MRAGLLVLGGLLVLRGARAAEPAAPYAQPQPPYQQQPAEQPPSSPAPYQQSLGPYQRPAVSDAPETQERPVWELAAPPSRHRHDGFYLRLAGGVGTGFDSIDATGQLGGRDGPRASSASGSVGGFTGATEVALGASPLPGFALGGGIYTATLAAPEADDLEFGGLSTPAGSSYSFTLTQLALFGVFADVYPWPSEGFHAQAGVGLATLVAGMGTPATAPGAALATPVLESHTGSGFGFMLGAGYEWWVGDEWSAGGLARLLYGWTSGSDRVGVSWSHATGAVALLLTATYH